jgi:hypothetical protein
MAVSDMLFIISAASSTAIRLPLTKPPVTIVPRDYTAPRAAGRRPELSRHAALLAEGGYPEGIEKAAPGDARMMRGQARRERSTGPGALDRQSDLPLNCAVSFFDAPAALNVAAQHWPFSDWIWAVTGSESGREQDAAARGACAGSLTCVNYWPG